MDIEVFLKKMEVDELTRDQKIMMSPLKLAYLGDAIYEAYIRTYLITAVKGKVHQLNKESVKFVQASAQGYVAKKLEGFLTDSEWSLLKRGRNQKVNVPKNAKVSDYKYATGFEALIGQLHLNHQTERIEEIIKKAIDLINQKEQEDE